MPGPDRADALRDAIESHLSGTPQASLAAAAAELRETYRSGRPPERVVLGSDLDVAAYAAYRMPATYAAVSAALAQVRAALPSFVPAHVVDAGAGTGAASWAVAAAYDVERLTLLEQSPAAVRLGRALAAGAPPPLRDAEWHEWRLSPRSADLPESDLLVCAYVLGEVDEESREAFVRAAATTARAVLLVEPGTPAGYARVVAARRALLAAGMRLVAPCPHEAECPLAGAPGDWCHFAARVERSALHRRLKEGSLGWEDEKFSYVAAVRDDVPHWPAARVLRHPQVRKGLVSLRLCAGDGTARQEVVTKRHGETYRAARKTGWGDRWPATDVAEVRDA